MIRRFKAPAALLAAGGIGATMALAIPASAASSNGYPTPAPTVTQPIPTPTYTVPPPVVNPFARCTFTLTFESTFDPAVGRFAFVRVPSITCVGPRGRLAVYTLTGPQEGR